MTTTPVTTTTGTSTTARTPSATQTTSPSSASTDSGHPPQTWRRIAVKQLLSEDDRPPVRQKQPTASGAPQPRRLPRIAPAPLPTARNGLIAAAPHASGSDLRLLKSELRKARNRESAQRSNQKRKQRLQKLKDELQQACQRASQLRARERSLREENRSLRDTVQPDSPSTHT